MPSACILQPGKIGDIIILIPVAKWYVNKGYKVFWPVISEYFDMFSYAVPYVEFIKINNLLYSEATQAVSNIDLFIDTYFGFADAKNQTEKWKMSGETFDRYKYNLAKVPFEQKFNLEIKRNSEREKKLFDSIVGRCSSYMVVHEECSSGKRSVLTTNDYKKYNKIIKISKVTDNIFDWLLVLEKASEYKMVDSCFVNLVSQIGFSAKGTRYWRYWYINERDYPVLRSNWITVK